MPIFIGMLLALAVAYLLIARTTGEDPSDDPIDVAVDAVVLLTSSEETRIAQLGPDAQQAFRLLLSSLVSAGIPVYVGQTLRTAAQEKNNIDSGKTAATLKVSWHEIGRAADLYPIDPDTGKPDLEGVRLDLFQGMHDIAAMQGFRGIAFNSDGSQRFIVNSRGHKIWDGGHLEYRYPYNSINEAIDAEGATYGVENA